MFWLNSRFTTREKAISASGSRALPQRLGLLDPFFIDIDLFLSRQSIRNMVQSHINRPISYLLFSPRIRDREIA
jgi:hypothetical protein